MAAPSNTVWGNTVNSYARIGIALSTSTNDTSVTVTANVYIWSKYSIHEQERNNTFYFDWDTTNATSNKGGVYVYTTSDSGSGWSTVNQQLIATYSKTYNRGSSSSTKNVAAKLTGINVASGTMSVSASFTVPGLSSYTVSYNANGGSGAPGTQVKYHGQNLTISGTRPTRTGYIFKGWGTSGSSTTPSYQPGSTYSANASITLYAIWELSALVEITATGSPSITISDNNGTGLAKVPSVSVPISVKYESANQNMDVYYRICYADSANGQVSNYETNSMNIINGPVKPTNIGSSLTISSELLSKAIQVQKNETQVSFVIQVCTGFNNFSNTFTQQSSFTVNITNFKRVSGELYGAWWTNSTTMQIIVEFNLSKSYSLSASAIIKPTFVNNSNSTEITNATTTVKSESDHKRVRYKFTVSNPAESFSQIKLTDGLTVGSVYVRIVPYSKDQSITIDKSTKTITAIEFIQHSELYGFQKGGRVYFPDFTELDEGNIGADALGLSLYNMVERD